MTTENKPLIKVDELFQAGIVVRDLQESIQQYQDLFGIGPWQTFDVGPMITSLTYMGKKVEKPSFLVGLAMAGPMQIELIQPITEDLPFADFLKERGEGLHHVGHVHVTDLAKAVHDLNTRGFSCIFEGCTPQMNFAYVDMTKTLGVIVELVEIPQTN